VVTRVTEQPGIEIDAGVHVGDVEAEMAQPADLERARIGDAADIVARLKC
jgi:class 3 adenylate cyclase